MKRPHIDFIIRQTIIIPNRARHRRWEEIVETSPPIPREIQQRKIYSESVDEEPQRAVVSWARNVGCEGGEFDCVAGFSFEVF